MPAEELETAEADPTMDVDSSYDGEDEVDPNNPRSIVTNPLLKRILEVNDMAKKVTAELLELQDTEPANEEEAQELSKKICDAQVTLKAHLATLRGMNRSMAKFVRADKQATADARAEIDTLHLGLQNLYYESRHLAGEIDACKNYPHTYTSLPLIPEEEFLEKFPEYRGKDEDVIMKARIEHEYEERVELEEKRKALVARKMELVRENARRKERLTKMDQDLENFIEAASPIQKAFEQEY